MSPDALKSRPETALWLLPAARDLVPLAAKIHQLAALFGAPTFTPHVTVFGGLTTPKEQLLEAMHTIARERGPFSLAPHGITHSELFFQCLVLDFGQAAEVLELRSELAPLVGKQPEEGARPHLSLLYAELPQDEREALAREIGLPATIHFDRLCLVAPGDGVAGWKAVAGWREVGRMELGG